MLIKVIDLSMRTTGDKCIIICPHAGGSPTRYRKWAQYLPDNIILKGLLLPGREGWYEGKLNSIQEIADELSAYIENNSNSEIILFGHSMGALVAYETARRTDKIHHLMVSGHAAPHIQNMHTPIQDLNDDALKNLLLKISGTPEAVIQNTELMNLLLPMIRHDFKLCDDYRFSSDNFFVNCPITAFSGLDDDRMDVNDINEWSKYTNNFMKYIYPGMHFFIFEHEFSLIQQIIQRSQEKYPISMEKKNYV